MSEFADEAPIDPAAVKKAETKRYGVKLFTVRELLEGSRDRALSEKPVTGCTTGNYELDDVTGGIRPGHVWVVGADTSWGKSSFIVAVTDKNLELGKRVLIVSSEDPPSMYGDRLMARRAKVPAKALRDRRLNDEEQEQVRRVVRRAKPDPVYINAVAMPAEDVAAKVQAIIKAETIDLVAFDYLQEFVSKARHQDRRNEVRSVAKILRSAVKESGAAGIILSQITVDASKDHPDKHSIRESRDVSNAAEVILLGFEPKKAISDKDGNTKIFEGEEAIWVDKVKDGPKGFAVRMAWEGSTASFERIDGPRTQTEMQQ